MSASRIDISASLGEKFNVQTTVRGNTVYIDQPAEAGGANAGPNPLESMAIKGRWISHH